MTKRKNNPTLIVLGNPPGRKRNVFTKKQLRALRKRDGDLAAMYDQAVKRRDRFAVSYIIGYAEATEWIQKNGRRQKATPRPDSGRRKNADPFAGLPKELVNDPTFRKNVKLYQKMHPGAPLEVLAINAPPGTPKVLVAYGNVPEIKYDAHNRSPKGRRVHKFGKNRKDQPLAVTAAGRSDHLQLVNTGSGKRFKAKDWIY